MKGWRHVLRIIMCNKEEAALSLAYELRVTLLRCCFVWLANAPITDTAVGGSGEEAK
jgi:hypothetical protein